MRIRQDKPFSKGYNPITRYDDKENPTLMDYGALILPKGHVESSSEAKERAYLLIQGEVTFEWEGCRVTAKRNSFLDENPWCLHVPANVAVRITGVGETSEISVTKTENETRFDSKLYTPEECASERRGEGTMKETSTRIVRTIFDKSNAPWSNLVLGEVINFPGKWSSYPPHHHLQPEIYYYKFYPQNGYGFSQLGEDVVKVKDSDTVLIINDESHPQVTAPGYAMYYVWVIRHLDGNPYITPTFEPEYLWVTQKGAVIWPDK
ncbi:MAG: 5-deoxy-glucuronate isomerase [Firmicutes bacterium]|nr:5-deoxy-glucuronate isomerase [Bacillota bacterium]